MSGAITCMSQSERSKHRVEVWITNHNQARSGCSAAAPMSTRRRPTPPTSPADVKPHDLPDPAPRYPSRICRPLESYEPS